MKRRICVVIFAILVVASWTLANGPRAEGAEKVKILMNWLFAGYHVPFFAARDKGYFKKNGIEVTLLQGRGSGKSARDVDTQQVEYSYGDFVTAVRAMSKGTKNRAVGAGMAFQGGSFVFFKESGIRTPKDLEGKRYGAPPTDVGKVLLPLMGAAAGFDASKVIIKNMKPAVRTPALFEGKIDFMTAVRGSAVPRMKIIAKRRGKEAQFFYFKDMGVQTYGHVLQTHQDRIDQNPDQVRNVVNAVFDGWAWAHRNRDKAFELFVKANPEKNREISRAQLEEGLTDGIDPETKAKGIGYMKESLVKKSVEIANKYFKLPKQVDYRTTYTNRFIRPNPGM
jgi:NitT/TauT family transport system substrate-binding protein